MGMTSTQERSSHVGSYDDIVDVLLEAEAVHEDEIEAEARY